MAGMDQVTDEEIARQVQSSNAEAFGVLVGRYEQKMKRYARKFLLASEEDDLVQEVFIKAYVNIQSFDVARKFSSWLYRIAHNEFINALRKRGRMPVTAFFDFDAVFPHPVARETADGALNRAELKQMVEKGLENLNPRYREPLVLYYFEEMDYKNIADVLHIPVSTVGVRLRRARAILKQFVTQS